MRVLKAVLLVLLIVLVIALIGAIFRLCLLLDVTTESMRSVEQLAQQSQVRIVGTSQNANAAIIQLGLTLDNVRRASESQDQVARKTLAILDNTNEVLLQARATLDHIDGQSAETLAALRKSLDGATAALEDSRTAIQHADKVISDPAIPQTLSAVNTSATNIANATNSVAASAETIHKKVEQLAKPVSLTKQILGKILGIAASAKTLFFK